MSKRAWLVAALASAPSAAWACPVCQDPNDPLSGAYFNMTMFMSLTPLLAIGAVLFWLYRRATALDS